MPATAWALRTQAKGSGVFRQRRPKADFDPRADRLVGFHDIDDAGRAVRLRPQGDSAIAGDDGKRALRRQHGTGNDAQAVAELSALRQAKEFAGTKRSADAEKLGNLFRRTVESRAVIFDKKRVPVAASTRPYPRRPPPSSALSPSSLRTSRRNKRAGTPAFCCRPSTVRNKVQSARSNIFKFGGFGSAPKLAFPAGVSGPDFENRLIGRRSGAF